MLTTRLSSFMQSTWNSVFSQSRMQQRAMTHAMAMPCVFGRRTITRTLLAMGRSDLDWSAEYKLFSRSNWSTEGLFTQIFDSYLERYRQGAITVALDDTKLARTGNRISSARWYRDAMSPPFHVNLVYGLRFLQASLIYPHHREGEFSARALPVAFEESTPLKKPGKRATADEWESYRLGKATNNLSTQSVALLKRLRDQLDQKGAGTRKLLAALDGSFCNRTVFKEVIDRVELIARCRKDARLCLEAPPESRKKYASELFTPEDIRKREQAPWHQVRIYYGGDRRDIRCKVVDRVMWRRGGGRRVLRLIVIAPLPYKVSPNSRTNYRAPAYLLTTDLASPLEELVQSYFDRWQIEVNHQEEKSILGVGQAQVWSEKSVSRYPTFAVACYSLLHLAALEEYGIARTDAYTPLPRWRRGSKRPSLSDIITKLRNECNEAPNSINRRGVSLKNMTLYASN